MAAKASSEKRAAGSPRGAVVFFDANLTIGPARQRSADVRWRTDEVLAELARCGIGAGLARSALAKQESVLTANRELLAETRARPGLYPLCVITPALLDLLPSEEEQWQVLAAQGVRAVIAHPLSHNVGYSVRHWARWADVLAAAHVPLFIEFSEIPASSDFEKFYDWVSLFDSTPVVLLDANWGVACFVLRLMETNPNLHLELSNWQAHHCPEFLVRHFGAERVLFGTGQPFKCPGAGRAAVDYADVGHAARSAIAGGNLQRLLDLHEVTTWPVVEAADPLAAAARLGTPVPTLVADAHAHVMDDDQRMVTSTVFPDSTPEEQMKVNTRVGIEFQCQASWTGPVNAAARIGNDILLRSQGKFPDNVIPMATVDPSQMTPDEIQAELRRLFVEGPAAGLKPYHTMGIPYHDAAWAPFFEFGNSRKLFTLLHPLGNLTWAPNSAQAQGIVDLAGRCPELSVLIAHSGGSFEYARTAVWIAKQAPRVFLELTLTPVTAGIVPWLVGEIGPERILFGTDTPMRDPRPQFGWVVHAAISEEAKRLILGLNFCRVLARCESNCPAIERVRAMLK